MNRELIINHFNDFQEYIQSEKGLLWVSLGILGASIAFLIWTLWFKTDTLKNDTLKTETVVEDPAIKLIDGFLSPEECKQLIEISKPKLERSFVVNGKNGFSIDDTRTSTSAHLGIGNYDLVDKIGKRACKFLGVPDSYLEPIQVVSYKPGQEYKSHYDYFMPDRIKFEKSQRTDTLFVYLNDEFEGGATDFPKLDRQIRGKVGQAIWWRNAPDGIGSEDSRLLHGGLPPTSGRKWGCNIWIRDRPSEEIK
jgi:prolyl 4-hydroxylase